MLPQSLSPNVTADNSITTPTQHFMQVFLLPFILQNSFLAEQEIVQGCHKKMVPKSVSPGNEKIKARENPSQALELPLMISHQQLRKAHCKS